MSGAKLVLLPKADGGIRPIAVGELIRRIAGKVLVKRYQPAISRTLAPTQLGVAAPRGVETVIHNVQRWILGQKKGEILAQIDLKNAYGCVDRQVFLAAIEEKVPSLLPYAMACYGAASTVCNSQLQASTQQGVHQGDPLSPLFLH